MSDALKTLEIEINREPDVWGVMEEAENFLKKGEHLIVTWPGKPLWASNRKSGVHNFATVEDVALFLKLGHFNVCETHKTCVSKYVIAEKTGPQETASGKLGVSVVIPCHNEASNVARCFARIPKMADFQEVIFVNDASTDRTKEEIQNIIEKEKNVKLISYDNHKGKGYAIKKGFEAASGDVLMILDADMAVMPEDLPRFFRIIKDQKADFVNGTRMMYPVNQAMNALHVFGNKVFGVIFSWILGQRITDTLCGTKAFLKKDYKKINFLSKNDPWGDFDLLLGAAEIKSRIAELPVRYQKRIFGYSKMRPFKHGFTLLVRSLHGIKILKIDKALKKIK